jgi:hypothetical protein
MTRRLFCNWQLPKIPALKKRPLTNLYNERPTWLKVAHHELDKAVLAAYAATDSEVDRKVLENLLRLNLSRAEPVEAQRGQLSIIQF